jgi:hypothetical protein
VHECAAGAENGVLPFYAVYDGNSGASALVRRAAGDVEIRADVMTLDSFIVRNGIERIDVMKVDVEGAEMLVFSGARALLSSDDAPAIFFEADDQLSQSFGVATRDVKRLLADHGYGIFRWERSRFVPVAVDETHMQENLFALKARHVAQMPKP